MANSTKPLTNTEVSQAKAKDKEYNLADGAGLSLRVKPNGTKSWLFNYSHPYTQKRVNITLGQYPEVGLADARHKRSTYREWLGKGNDPRERLAEQARKEQEAHGDTLQVVAEQWLKVKQSKVTEEHAHKIWRSLERHIFPKLGRVPIHKITAPMAIQTIQPLADTDSNETVKRVCQRLNEIMAYAVNSGRIVANPLSGIRAAFIPPDVEPMPALAPAELPELMQALTTASITMTIRCLIEWQLHTMVRPAEAAATRWDEIDMAAAVWQIPKERMKGKKRGHSVPLSAQALALLERMLPLSGRRDYVFPAARNPASHASKQAANAALKRMGFKDRLVAHGLRSIASTTLNEQGFDADVIEAALAHVDKDAVRAAYNRTDYLERRAVMMAWWSDHIEKAATGNMSLSASHKGLRLASSQY